jgi:hypothetical protein
VPAKRSGGGAPSSELTQLLGRLHASVSGNALEASGAALAQALSSSARASGAAQQMVLIGVW